MVSNGKVCFITHDVYQDHNNFPIGIGYLSAILKRYGADVKIYCQDVFHYPNEVIADFLKKESYDIIGLGFLAARFKETVLNLCEIINHYKKDAWLVLGSHGPSAIPEYMLNKTKADIIAIGEAEETIIDILKCKLDNKPLSDVDGIAYRTGNEVFINNRRKPIKDLNSIPFPEYLLFPMENYISNFKMLLMNEKDRGINMISSRGCINKCSFCYRLEKGMRFRSVNNVIDEIRFLNEKYGITYLSMSDELFTYPKKRILEFCDVLSNSNLNIKYQCAARVDNMDKEFIQVLKDSGCTFINFGIESSDQCVLDLMNKNTTVEQNINAVNIAKEVGIGYSLNMLWGHPGDTEEILRNNAEMIKKYNSYIQLRTIRPVTPYPGSPLYYKAIERGLLSGPEDFFKKFQNSDYLTVNFTDIPDEKFLKLMYEVNKDLIYDHYNNTTKNIEEAEKIIKQFHDLYFKGFYKFRGVKRYKSSNNT